MPFNHPGYDDFPPPPDGFAQHPSLQTIIPKTPLAVDELPKFGSTQHKDSLRFYSTSGCPDGRAVIFVNATSFTYIYRQSDQAKQKGIIASANEVVPKAEFSQAELTMRKWSSLRRVVLLTRRLTTTELCELSVDFNHFKREALFGWATTTKIYRRKCIRCQENQNCFPYCAVDPQYTSGGPIWTEEKCLGCQFAGETCVFPDKIHTEDEEGPDELSQETLVKVVTHPWVSDTIGRVNSAWTSLATAPQFRSFLENNNDYFLRSCLQEFQVNLLALLNLCHQVNLTGEDILHIPTLPKCPLLKPTALNTADLLEAFTPYEMDDLLQEAALSDRIASAPFQIVPPLYQSPSPSGFGSQPSSRGGTPAGAPTGSMLGSGGTPGRSGGGGGTGASRSGSGRGTPTRGGGGRTGPSRGGSGSGSASRGGRGGTGTAASRGG